MQDIQKIAESHLNAQPLKVGSGIGLLLMSQSQKRKVKETSPVFPVWDKKHRTMDPLLKEMMEKMEKNLLAQMKLSEGIINQNIDSKLQVLEKSIDSRLVKIDEELKVLQEENQALRDDNTRLSSIETSDAIT